MKIAELFHSIQGEGMLSGMPSVFVRTSGCNLRCVWCDTPYTSWAPEGDELNVGMIAEQVNRFQATHVVLTGGEPMIAPGIAELTEELRASGKHITIETAGTVFEKVVCDLMSISPKLANSTPHLREAGRWAAHHERLRYRPEVLRRLMAHYPYQLKFVVATPDDLPEIEQMVTKLQADRSRVLLMPEGVDNKILQVRGLWLAELCKEHGFRFSPRLHVALWGDRRGV